MDFHLLGSCMLDVCKRRFFKDVSSETLFFDIMLESKIEEKVLQEGVKINKKSKMVWKSIFHRFFVDFGSMLGAKMAPKSSQDRCKRVLENGIENSV